MPIKPYQQAWYAIHGPEVVRRRREQRRELRGGRRTYLEYSREERFWMKVDRSGECWAWLGASRTRGANGEKRYGQFWDQGRNRPAQVVAWELANGRPFPEGMDGCHHCDNPTCVRPDHVFPGTARENALDMVAKGRNRNGATRRMEELTDAA
jgi:hypothetical protein